MAEAPRVFISYSHDSDAHRALVLRFAERLRADGIDADLDQYVKGTPAETWPQWMLNRLDWATFVLLICTPTYYRRFRGLEEPGKGKGVAWEGAIITNEVYDARNQTAKFVPVLFPPSDLDTIPEPVRGRSAYGLTSEAEYHKLSDFLHGRSGVERRPLGAADPQARDPVEPLTFPPGDQTAGALKSRDPSRPPTLVLRLDRIGESLSVRPMDPPQDWTHATPLADIDRALDRKDGDVLFRSLFPSPHALTEGVAAAGGRPQDGDPCGHPLQLRLHCTDATVATLPWHYLSQAGQRLGEAGWVMEISGAEGGGELSLALDNPLVIATSDPVRAAAIGARSHAAEVSAHLRRLLADRRTPVQWVGNRREVEVALRNNPDLIYCFAEVGPDGCLTLGAGPDPGQCLAVADLLPPADAPGPGPILWLHLIEDRGATLDRGLLWALHGRASLLIIQTTSRANLERSLRHTLDWMSAMAEGRSEPAEVLSRLGDGRIQAWLGGRSLRLRPGADPDQALLAQIRAALIRILLGRKTERLLIFDGIRQAPGASLILYAVCGDEHACVHDLPEQTRQYVEEIDRSILVETRPIPFVMRNTDDPDAIARQLKQDLSIGFALPPSEALRRIPVVRPEPEDTLVIALSWLLTPDPGFDPKGMGNWLRAWKQATFDVLEPEEIPRDTRVLVGACIQWPAGWPEDHGTDAATLHGGIAQALRRNNPGDYVRTIDIEHPLGLVKEAELIAFYRNSDARLRKRLGADKLDLDRLADYLLEQAHGRFQETVELIYRECKQGYADFAAFLETQVP